MLYFCEARDSWVKTRFCAEKTEVPEISYFIRKKRRIDIIFVTTDAYPLILLDLNTVKSRISVVEAGRIEITSMPFTACYILL